MIKPKYGRKLTMDIVADSLSHIHCPVILEIGMTRIKDNWLHDGYSTIFFSWIVNQYNGELYSIDINPNAIETCRQILEEHELFSDNVHLINQDALNYLDTFDKKINVLYLDGWDYTVTDPRARTVEDPHINHISETSHLVSLQKVEHLLVPGSMIIVDDVLNNSTFYGKGKLVIPYMIENGYELNPISFNHDPEIKERAMYQFLFTKK